MLSFIAGLIVGGSVGVFFMAMLQINRYEEIVNDEMEEK